MNVITQIAKGHDRKYITPEDVSDALSGHPPDRVRLDVLEVLGKQTDFGAEDGGLCAFIAWRGTIRNQATPASERNKLMSS